ncbi:hypothetical protein COV16_02825 [Candidatus Woesearchaeota archaeon CG10_big_fil_rev_8_21_14_0_10_34_8]|nr:MAG: hypothetical protein COV16_02825 [Candidatus Woesearchaeota archaeon CG10_big_fil_rev_8_21_14_0_10_34_8]
MNWEIIGFIGAACTTFCFIPQLYKAYKTKKLEDFAYPYLAVLAVGILGWLIYGLSISDRVVISANALTLLFVLTLIGMKYHYNGKI